jgi:hypothetical protein
VDIGDIGSDSPDQWQDVAGIIILSQVFWTTTCAAVVIVIVHAYSETM